jgi:hypothetical protein
VIEVRLLADSWCVHILKDRIMEAGTGLCTMQVQCKEDPQPCRDTPLDEVDAAIQALAPSLTLCPLPGLIRTFTIAHRTHTKHSRVHVGM